MTLAVISTYAAYASFIMPSGTPDASTQDWGGNVLGANNADNAYDSTIVAGNHNGSLLERAEDVRRTIAENGYDSSYATANANGSVLQRLKDIETKVSAISGGGAGNDCEQVNGFATGSFSYAACTSGRHLINGGCYFYGGSTDVAYNIYRNGPDSLTRWYCETKSTSFIIQARAICCK